MRCSICGKACAEDTLLLCKTCQKNRVDHPFGEDACEYAYEYSYRSRYTIPRPRPDHENNHITRSTSDECGRVGDINEHEFVGNVEESVASCGESSHHDQCEEFQESQDVDLDGSHHSHANDGINNDEVRNVHGIVQNVRERITSSGHSSDEQCYGSKLLTNDLGYDVVTMNSYAL